MKSHFEDRPFKCEYCDSSFKTSDKRLRHTRSMHIGPFCVACGNFYVKDPEAKCGACSKRAGKKERAVFKFLAKTDWRLGHFVRDQPLGCGVRRRPDGYLDLLMEAGDGVMFILEVDEFFHRRNTPECELERLEQIHDRYKEGPLYVIRYNPDQLPYGSGLSDEKLTALANRCAAVLDEDHVNAREEPSGILIEYHGYPEARVAIIGAAFMAQQIREGQFPSTLEEQ